MAQDKVVPLSPVRGSSAPPGVVLGWVVRVDDAGIWVDSDAFEGGPRVAISVVRLTLDELDDAIREGREAVLSPVEGTGQLVLLGLRQPHPAVHIDRPFAPGDGDTSSATIDGKTLRLEGHDEVVLRCGKASITMRRNGRVVIRGVQVESRATGRNRIKGGTVLIN